MPVLLMVLRPGRRPIRCNQRVVQVITVIQAMHLGYLLLVSRH